MKHELDFRYLRCPLPVLRLKKAIKNSPPGTQFAILTTDPGSLEDFKSFCRITGNDLLSCKKIDSVFHFLIKMK